MIPSTGGVAKPGWVLSLKQSSSSSFFVLVLDIPDCSSTTTRTRTRKIDHEIAE